MPSLSQPGLPEFFAATLRSAKYKEMKAINLVSQKHGEKKDAIEVSDWRYNNIKWGEKKSK